MPRKKLFQGLLIGLLLPFVFGYLFVISGGMPVAVKDPELPLEHWIAKKALRKAYANDLEKKAPFELTSEHENRGMTLYRNNCGGCHGVEDRENKMAKAMFPPVPQFFQKGSDITEDPEGKIFWKIKNGIRLTGMPGYSDILNDTEIWEITLFLRSGKKLRDEQ